MRETTARASADRPAKRAYEPPRIIFREPLEGVAAVCDPPGKVMGNPICSFTNT